jgi:hypothetical protein
MRGPDVRGYGSWDSIASEKTERFRSGRVAQGLVRIYPFVRLTGLRTALQN